MDMKRFFLYAIVIAALALAGCGGNGGTTAQNGNGNGNGNGVDVDAERMAAARAVLDAVIDALQEAGSDIPDGATQAAVLAAIGALDPEDPIVATIRAAVNAALGDDATDNLAADVMTLANAYRDAQQLLDDNAAAEASMLARGFLYALAGRTTPQNTNDGFTLNGAGTTTTAKLTSDGLEVTLNGDAEGMSAFATSATRQGAAPDIPGGTWHKTILDDPDASQNTFEVAAVYSDAEGPVAKSLLTDENAATGANNFAIPGTDEAAREAALMMNAMLNGAPSAPTTGSTTVILGNSRTPAVGDARLEIDGSWRGVPGTFICTSGGGCNDTATNGLSVSAMQNADGETVLTYDLRGQTWVFAPSDPMATVMVDDEDYLYLGWWHEVPNEEGDGATPPAPNPHGFVAFANGSQPFAGAGLDALTGDATYTGVATGKYAQQQGTLLNPTYHADAFTATASLTAKFGADDAAGTIEGSITNFRDSAGDAMAGWKVTLESVDLTSNTSTWTGGTAEAEVAGVASDRGNWGGAFFGNGREDGEPGSAAGTFNAEWGADGTGEHTALSGAYGVHHD